MRSRARRRSSRRSWRVTRPRTSPRSRARSGSKAVAKPKFDFKGTTGNQAKFQATAEVLEYTGVSAYLGQVGNISSEAGARRCGIDPAGRGLARRLDRGSAPPRRQALPGPIAFAAGKTKAQILAAVKGTGFIVG